MKNNLFGWRELDNQFPGVGIISNPLKSFFFASNIFIAKAERCNLAVLQHEYGHFIQFVAFGARYYYFTVMPESIKTSKSNQHLAIKVEMEASSFANAFFGPGTFNIGGYSSIFATFDRWDERMITGYNKFLDYLTAKGLDHGRKKMSIT